MRKLLVFLSLFVAILLSLRIIPLYNQRCQIDGEKKGILTNIQTVKGQLDQFSHYTDLPPREITKVFNEFVSQTNMISAFRGSDVLIKVIGVLNNEDVSKGIQASEIPGIKKIDVVLYFPQIQNEMDVGLLLDSINMIEQENDVSVFKVNRKDQGLEINATLFGI